MFSDEDRAKLVLVGAVVGLVILCFVGWQLFTVLTWEHVTFGVGVVKLIFQSVAWVLGIGVVVSVVTNLLPVRQNITLLEFITWMVIFTLVIAPLSSFIGWNKANQVRLTRNELWHGSEVNTTLTPVDCTEDGPCVHEFDCHPYDCNPHDCNCDSDGKNCSTCYDTCYHDCPYCNKELVAVVNTTVGDFTTDDHVFEENPQKWDPFFGPPIPANVPRGVSQFWKDADARVKADKPGPVSVVKQYENPILASDLTILKNYSAQIEEFRQMGIIPSPDNPIYNFYWVNEVNFVGFTPANLDQWQVLLHYLNAAFGDDLTGDMRIVVVNNAYAEANAEAYLLALKADWQDEAKYGDNLASKNTLIIILFTRDNTSISKAAAITGMPLGNEYLLERIGTVLQGKPLDPSALFGYVTGHIYLKTYDDPNKQPKLKVEYEHDDPGLIEDLAWGISDPATKFNRVSMSKNFQYLWKEVVPKPEQQAAVRNWTIFFGIIGWLIAVAVGERDVFHHRQRRRATTINW